MLFLLWRNPDQQILNVILEHNYDEQAAQDHSLSNDVGVGNLRQVESDEDVCNCQR